MTQAEMNRIAHNFVPRMGAIVTRVLRKEKVVVREAPRPPIRDRMDAFLRGKLQSFEVPNA